MRLAPSFLVRLCGDVGRKRHVQAPVVLRMQVGELTPGLERLDRAGRGVLFAHERKRIRDGDQAVGGLYPGQLERASRKLAVERRR
jgi:hypothetical protein